MSQTTRLKNQTNMLTKSVALANFKNCLYLDSYWPQYFATLNRFLKWSSKETYDGLVDLNHYEIHSLLDSYLKQLSLTNRNSVLESVVERLALFYSQNEIHINCENLLESFPDDERILGIPYTIEEIKKLFFLAESPKKSIQTIPRTRAMLFFLATSGCRLSNLEHLQIQDLIPIKNTYAIEFNIHFLTNDGSYSTSKTPSFTTFITPEARGELDRYLKTRSNLKSTSWVFDQSLNAMRLNLKRLVKLAEIDKIVCSSKKIMNTDQGFRKRFFNILEKNNLSEQSIRWIKEESIYKKRIKFSKTQLAEFYSEYEKAIPDLTLFN